MVTQPPEVSPFGHYSKTQAARILEVDRKTIYRWCRDGKLKTCWNKVLNTSYIPGSSILRLCDGK